MSSPPRKIGPYTLVRRLEVGRGIEAWFGVMEGPQPRTVVVRRFPAHALSGPEEARQVDARVQDLLGVRHPFLVQVLDWLEEGGDRFLVENRVEGLDLGRILRWCKENGTLVPPNVFLNLATQLCNGLEALHGRTGRGTGSASVLHLGIRPQALVVTREGRIVLGSYALAPAAGAHPALRGAEVNWLAPEQVRPDQPLSPSTDIFALGAILYELFMLQRLFDGDTNLEVLEKVARAEVSAPLLAVRARMPGLEKVLHRALAQHSRHRYQRAFVMREDLRGLMAGFSFATIADDTREFLDPIFSGTTLFSSEEAAEEPDAFNDEPDTRLDPDPTATAARVARRRAAAERPPSRPPGVAAVVVPPREAPAPGRGRTLVPVEAGAAPAAPAAETTRPLPEPPPFGEATRPLPETPPAEPPKALPPRAEAPTAHENTRPLPPPPPARAVAGGGPAPAARPAEPPPASAPPPPGEPPRPAAIDLSESVEERQRRRRIQVGLGVALAVALLLLVLPPLLRRGRSPDPPRVVQAAPPPTVPAATAPPAEPVPPAPAPDPEEAGPGATRETEPEATPAPAAPSARPEPVARREPPSPRRSAPPARARTPSRVTTAAVVRPPPEDDLFGGGPDEGAFEEEPVEEATAEPVATPVEGYVAAARAGRLSDGDRMFLEMIDRADRSYTRSRAILLMNAEAAGDVRAEKRYLDQLMEVPENRYNPVFLSKQARWLANRGDYRGALEKANLAERYWARIPPELVFSTKAEIYEVQAAARQGLFYKTEDLDLLEEAIRSWEKLRDHALTRDRRDLARHAQKQVDKLVDARERLQ